ncbi:MAG: cupin domain-containing protein [Bacteroidetes bacterium]|nr:cupin domain-containing protein [Bacteroidota bacterium]
MSIQEKNLSSMLNLSLKNNLDELINYQDNSVVSKTLINKKSGTVTMFAFDKGQGLSEHTAPFDAMVFIADGEAEVSIESEAQILKKGEIIILPAGKPHSVQSVSRFKMLLIMIKS